jgi:hypothetical protein
MSAPYRSRSAETWDQARDAYLAGEPAEGVCARFDLGLSNFRNRARREGWRRADQADPDPVGLDDGLDDEDLDAIADADLQRMARRRMTSAARRGHVGEALRWARFGEIVARRAVVEAVQAARIDRANNQRANALLRDVTASARSVEVQARAILATGRASAKLDEVGELHAVSNAVAAEGPAPSLSRADRRRMLKQGRKRR